MTVDKWSFPQEDRYFPCEICNKPKFCFIDELTEECKPNKPVVCSDCYVSENPTRGWMLTQAKKLGTLNFDHYKTLSESQQETYLKKLLKIKKETKGSESDYTKDDR